MSPITSPDNHRPIRPASSVDINLGNDETGSDIHDVKGIKNDDLTVFQYINKESGLDLSYNSDFMEMDGTYKHNIKISLTFTDGAEPESICNVNECNHDGPAIKPNAKNQFKDPLKTCVAASGLNREMILHLILHSNQYSIFT